MTKQNSRKPLTFGEWLLLPILLRTRRGDALDLLKRRLRYSRQLAEYKKGERILAKTLEKEAKIYAQLIVNCWVRRRSAFLARSAHISTEGNPVTVFKVVKPRFGRIRTDPERIWFQILVGERTMFGAHKDMLPFGVDVAQLTNDEALFELGMACQRKVEAWIDTPDKGAWVIVNRLEGVGGIPRQVSWEHMLPHYSGSTALGPIVLGSGEMRALQVTNLADTFHILIAGSSGGGKSNMINSIICGLLRFTSPEEVKLILVDPKRLELGMYESVPHLMRPIVFDPAEAVAEFRNLMTEIQRRTALMQNKAKELAEWNEQYPDQTMPRIVVIVDEFAQLMLMPEKKIAKQAQDLIVQIVNMGRSLGVHLILATQYPNRSVLTNNIKINMGLTIAARTQNQSQSIVIIGTGDASNLPKIPGRMICLSGSSRFEVQTPLIRREDVTQSIAISKGKAAGLITVDGPDVVINRDRVICYIMDELKGILNPEVLWRRFAPYGIPARDLKLFINEVIKAREYSTSEPVEPYVVPRDFTAHLFGDEWRLVETTPEYERRPETVPEAESIYPVDTDKTFLRLVGVAPVAPLQIEAPKVARTVIAPEPERPADEIVNEFIQERCNVGKRLQTTSKELNEAYRQWCAANDHEALSPQAFGKLVSSLGFMRSKDSDGTRLWKGLAVSETQIDVEAA